MDTVFCAGEDFLDGAILRPLELYGGSCRILADGAADAIWKGNEIQDSGLYFMEMWDWNRTVEDRWRLLTKEDGPLIPYLKELYATARQALLPILPTDEYFPLREQFKKEFDNWESRLTATADELLNRACTRMQNIADEAYSALYNSFSAPALPNKLAQICNNGLPAPFLQSYQIDLLSMLGTMENPLVYEKEGLRHYALRAELSSLLRDVYTAPCQELRRLSSPIMGNTKRSLLRASLATELLRADIAGQEALKEMFAQHWGSEENFVCRVLDRIRNIQLQNVTAFYGFPAAERFLREENMPPYRPERRD
ncbi:MAG: hypothetical protein IIV90_02870 [Oscillospiraceae bacterium]|nr:hypothetical protein [Oscillospiraceae bacterium]